MTNPFQTPLLEAADLRSLGESSQDSPTTLMR